MIDYGYADLSDASLQDGLRAAEAAYEARNKWLRDAWRTMGGGPGGTARTTAPPADKPGESARDAYVRRISSWPPGSVSDPAGSSPDDNDDDTKAIETQREAWPARGQAATMAMPLRQQGRRRKTRSPTAIRPAANISTGSATGGGDDPARRP